MGWNVKLKKSESRAKRQKIGQKKFEKKTRETVPLV